MGRSPCCSKEGLNRGAWTVLEDKILSSYINIHGEGKWRNLPKRAGLKRCGKSCRLRWLNYLRPDIKRGNITEDEEELIIRLHNLLGNRWSLIAGRLPGRTDNEIKNYWNTNICKKVKTQTKSNQSHQDRKTKPLTITPRHNDQGSNSILIRTKASRCTKVVIDNIIKPIRLEHASTITNVNNFSSLESESKSRLTFKENNSNYSSTNFMMNIEMDDQFLSEFLNEEFSPLQCYHSEGDCGLSSPNCGRPLISFPNDYILDNCDFESSYSLIEHDLDWLD